MLTMHQHEEARQEIRNGIKTAPARSNLLRRLVILRKRQDNIRINYYDNRHKEFGLSWITDDGHPYMHGGLVYHSHDDTWGVHT